MELPAQRLDEDRPEIFGSAFMVTVVVTGMPETVYVMTAAPAVTPVTIPVLEPTVATPLLPLLQVPPTVALLKVVVLPTQAIAVPVFLFTGSFLNTDRLPDPEFDATMSGL